MLARNATTAAANEASPAVPSSTATYMLDSATRLDIRKKIEESQFGNLNSTEKRYAQLADHFVKVFDPHLLDTTSDMDSTQHSTNSTDDSHPMNNAAATPVPHSSSNGNDGTDTSGSLLMSDLNPLILSLNKRVNITAIMQTREGQTKVDNLRWSSSSSSSPFSEASCSVTATTSASASTASMRQKKVSMNCAPVALKPSTNRSRRRSPVSEDEEAPDDMHRNIVSTAAKLADERRVKFAAQAGGVSSSPSTPQQQTAAIAANDSTEQPDHNKTADASSSVILDSPRSILRKTPQQFLSSSVISSNTPYQPNRVNALPARSRWDTPQDTAITATATPRQSSVEHAEKQIDKRVPEYGAHLRPRYTMPSSRTMSSGLYSAHHRHLPARQPSVSAEQPEAADNGSRRSKRDAAKKLATASTAVVVDAILPTKTAAASACSSSATAAEKPEVSDEVKQPLDRRQRPKRNEQQETQSATTNEVSTTTETASAPPPLPTVETVPASSGKRRRRRRPLAPPAARPNSVVDYPLDTSDLELTVIPHEAATATVMPVSQREVLIITPRRCRQRALSATMEQQQPEYGSLAANAAADDVAAADEAQEAAALVESAPTVLGNDRSNSTNAGVYADGGGNANDGGGGGSRMAVRNHASGRHYKRRNLVSIPGNEKFKPEVIAAKVLHVKTPLKRGLDGGLFYPLDSSAERHDATATTLHDDSNNSISVSTTASSNAQHQRRYQGRAHYPPIRPDKYQYVHTPGGSMAGIVKLPLDGNPTPRLKNEPPRRAHLTSPTLVKRRVKFSAAVITADEDDGRADKRRTAATRRSVTKRSMHNADLNNEAGEMKRQRRRVVRHPVSSDDADNDDDGEIVPNETAAPPVISQQQLVEGIVTRARTAPKGTAMPPPPPPTLGERAASEKLPKTAAISNKCVRTRSKATSGDATNQPPPPLAAAAAAANFHATASEAAAAVYYIDSLRDNADVPDDALHYLATNELFAASHVGTAVDAHAGRAFLRKFTFDIGDKPIAADKPLRRKLTGAKRLLFYHSAGDGQLTLQLREDVPATANGEANNTGGTLVDMRRWSDGLIMRLNELFVIRAGQEYKMSADGGNVVVKAHGFNDEKSKLLRPALK